MSIHEDLFGPDPFQQQMWQGKAIIRQAMLKASTSDKSIAELKAKITEYESQLPSLVEQQENIIELWSSAVARIKEKPFVEFYMHKCGPRQLLEFAESYFSSGTGPVISTDIQQQYYYEEKLEILRNLIDHGPDYLENYHKMIDSIRTYIEQEAKSSTWDRWDNDYVTKKMIKWLKEWKGRYLT